MIGTRGAVPGKIKQITEVLSFKQKAGKDVSAPADTSADPWIGNPYTFLRFTVSHGGAKKSFRETFPITCDSGDHARSRRFRSVVRFRLYAACPALNPDAQAHWKLKPPRWPVTSTTSPMKYNPGTFFDSIVCDESSLVSTPPAVTSAFA